MKVLWQVLQLKSTPFIFEMGLVFFCGLAAVVGSAESACLVIYSPTELPMVNSLSRRDVVTSFPK